MYELKDALTSLDDHGHKINIIPAEVRGLFRKWRSITQFILILIFLILPWTKINGYQTVLVDIYHRKFAFFGIQFWSHDGPLIFFILAILTLGLALMTALFGRIWCGWACPQTVFVDGIFRRIEILVEGKYIERRKLAQAKMSPQKFIKTAIKWLLFTVVSSVIAHSFIAYFSGAEALLTMIKGGPAESWSYFLLVTAMTVIILFDFGWFREQFCIVMCPYGRFQSVLLDQNSVSVLYDEKRGEPRKGVTSEGKQGDCVACNRCVQVCPTGIDIRKGVQLECIACTACIDACNDIMAKVKKPGNLIRYSSLNASEGLKTKFLRPRVVIYSFFILMAGIGLASNIFGRSGFMVTVLRAHETPYQVLKEQGHEDVVINHFKLHLHNQSNRVQKFTIALPPEVAASGVKLTLPPTSIEIAPTADREIHFFVMVPIGLFGAKGQWDTTVSIAGDQEAVPVSRPLVLVGPERSTP